MPADYIVPGLRHVPGFLEQGEQEALLRIIDGLPWRNDLRRRVQHYGYRYDYRRRTVDREMFLGALPEWATDLSVRFEREGYSAHGFDQVIVNEYLPGQGISPHVDCIPCFAETIISLSFESSCVLSMSKRGAARVGAIDVLLAPGDLLALEGPARYDWLHGIAARKTDRYAGQTITRGRRISLTFRKVVVSSNGE